MISVGNIAVGGRGKTPLVAYIARRLLAAGEQPAILSRGYGRRRPDPGVVVVSDGRHLLADLDRSGDEPLMLARDVPGARVLVCEERAMAGALAERALGATVHVLDDGFQHRQLARDVDIVVVAARDFDDRRLPFGRLREPLAALGRADVIVSADDIPAQPSSGSAVGTVPQFRLRQRLGDPCSLDPARPWSADRGRVLALAGIAQPDRFPRALEAAGWTVSDTISFRDHHRYSPRDVARIAQIAARAGLPILTTAKDAVRLLPLRPLPMNIAAVPLEVSVEPADEFDAWLRGRLDEVRHARA